MDKQDTRSYSPEARAIIEAISTSARKSSAISAIKKDELIVLYSDKKWAIQEIANYFNVPKYRIFEALNHYGIEHNRAPGAGTGRHLKPKEITMIRRMRRDGLDVKHIAEVIDTSVKTVRRHSDDIVRKAKRAQSKAAKPQAKPQVAPVQAEVIVTYPSLWSRIKAWFKG